MSLKPIDMQVMVPKMTEIAGSQGSESARRLVAAQHGSESARVMVEADTREVHTKKNAQEVIMRVNRERDGDGRGGHGKKRGGHGDGGKNRNGAGVKNPGEGFDSGDKNTAGGQARRSIDIRL